MWNPFKAKSYSFLPKVTYLTALASTNLFVLAIRLVQFFFSGVVLGVIASYIDLQLKAGDDASSPYIFILTVAAISMATQFGYCFSYQHKLFFLWDLFLAVFWILSFFWLLNFVSGSLTCSWTAFNPFGSDKCAQTRSVLVIQIVLTLLWTITGLIQAYDVHRGKRVYATKIEV